MSGSGGKGGTTVNEQQIDPRLAAGSAAAVSGALQAAGLDYAPNRGETIAAFTPQQEAAFRGANEAAAAFGLPTGGVSLPPPNIDPVTGMATYSTGSLYDANVASSMTPEQQAERSGILQQFRERGVDIGNMPAPEPVTGGGGK